MLKIALAATFILTLSLLGIAGLFRRSATTDRRANRHPNRRAAGCHRSNSTCCAIPYGSPDANDHANAGANRNHFSISHSHHRAHGDTHA